MGSEAKVVFAQDGALGAVTLQSPPLNLIGQELIDDLLAAIDQVEAASGLFDRSRLIAPREAVARLKRTRTPEVRLRSIPPVLPKG